MEQTLLNVFVQAIWAGSIVPFSNQNQLFGLFGFKSDVVPYAILAAVVGNMLGFAFNWHLGSVIYYFTHKNQRILHSNDEVEEELHGLKPKQPWQRFAWVALLLVWVPLGSFLTVAAGAIKISLDKTILAAGFAMLLFYVYQAGYMG